LGPATSHATSDQNPNTCGMPVPAQSRGTEIVPALPGLVEMSSLDGGPAKDIKMNHKLSHQDDVTSTFSCSDSVLHDGPEDDKFTLIFSYSHSHRSRFADAWFMKLESVHHIVARDRADDARRVRVAILDTGVDATHSLIQSDLDKAKAIRSIKALKGFPSSLDPKKDKNGHGTHGVSVLLKTAPYAAIYVARVADDQGKIDPNGIIAVHDTQSQ
jgi:hypothetical protein